jgi:subtilase family serine protease
MATPATGTRIGEQFLAFPGQASTIVTFSAAVNDGNEHVYTIVVNPDNLIKESNKLNNTAIKALYPQATYDFEILPQDITVSTNPANFLQDVTITSKVTNKGTMNAYNVQVKYYIDDPVAPFEIATQTLDPQGDDHEHNDMASEQQV